MPDLTTERGAPLKSVNTTDRVLSTGVLGCRAFGHGPMIGARAHVEVLILDFAMAVPFRSALRPSWPAAVAGALGFCLIHVQFVLLWSAVYARYPWKGSEWAMAHGRVEPAFSNSPRALAVCVVALAVLGVLIACLVHDRLFPTILGSCGGVFAAAIGLSLTVAEFRQSNLAPLAAAFYPVVLFPPLAAGVLVGRGALRLTGFGAAHDRRGRDHVGGNRGPSLPL